MAHISSAWPWVVGFCRVSRPRLRLLDPASLLGAQVTYHLLSGCTYKPVTRMTVRN